MRSIGWLFAFLVVLVPTTGSSSAADAQSEIRVDCSQPQGGYALARALKRADQRPGTTIRIAGYCQSINSTTAQGLRLIGDGPDRSGIGDLLIVGPGEATVEDLRIGNGLNGLGWGKLSISSPSRAVFVSRCVLDAVVVDSGSYASLEKTRVGTYGPGSGQGVLAVFRGAQALVNGCSLYGGLFSAYVAGSGSGLVMRDTEVFGAGAIGIADWGGATVELENVNLHDNGTAHIIVEDRSRIAVRNSNVGAPADPTPYAFIAALDSTLQLTNDVVGYGALGLATGSAAWLDGMTLHGSITLLDFSTLRLANSHVDGKIECASGGDAFCGVSSSAATAGCPSAPADCSASTAKEYLSPLESLPQRRPPPPVGLSDLPVVPDALTVPRPSPPE